MEKIIHVLLPASLDTLCRWRGCGTEILLDGRDCFVGLPISLSGGAGDWNLDISQGLLVGLISCKLTLTTLIFIREEQARLDG
jgi:hypothetical protein